MATRRPSKKLPSKPPVVRRLTGRREAGSASFPIVGVGASAGGLDAFRQLMDHVPADAGLALVLVQHLEAARPSLLSDALASSTTMKVTQARDGDRVEPNRVYVIPPGVQLAIEQGVLRLSPLDEQEQRPHLPIDFFLSSLAAERGRRAIGVILSGTASDGTAGLTAIRAHGGITFAQDPQTARFSEMPRHAVDAGVVDFCLSLPALGAELVRLASHPYLTLIEPVSATPVGAATVSHVLALVRSATGVDFSEYKPATLRRRLARRLAVRKSKDLAAYLQLLRSDPAEVRLLYDDLLIKVTSFFRDPQCFEDLRTIALPEILKHKAPGAPVRAWVVGCATGEEVYSLAITILEHLSEESAVHPVIIFGSDLSEQAVEIARAGLYGEASLRGLSPERLARFFVRTERGWRVSQAVRELCVFLRHDVARDPPLSRLDLLSCRNVLIYFGRALQRRVLEAAHYALNQPGYLLLGGAESATGVPRWFAPQRPGGQLFRRRLGPSAFRFSPRTGAFPYAPGPPSAGASAPAEGALARHVDELVMARYGPPGVVVNDRLEVLQFRGRTGPYLEPPQGEPQSQLLKMARQGLAGPLRVALAQARRLAAPVRKEGVAIEEPAGGRSCDLVVVPLKAPSGGDAAFLVLFEERPPAPPAPRPGSARGRPGRRTAASRAALEDELASTKEHLAALLEEHGRGNEALTSANDELVSGNEELQSLNEELETAKEEVQATNEELTTVNEELHGRNQELQLLNADVLNLLDAVEIPILMLDEGRRLRRFTRLASSFLGLAPSDVGRRITELDLPLHAPDLEAWITRAMTEVTLVEAEVHDRTQHWHRLQIRPHRTAAGLADGAILSLVDIDELRQEVVLARWSRDYARSIVEAVQVPLLVVDLELRVLSANAAYYRHFQERPADTEGRLLFELGGGEWDAPGLRRAMDGLVAGEASFRGVELIHDFPGPGHRVTSLSGSAIPASAGPSLLLLAIEDVTEQREVAEHRADLLADAEAARRRAEQADHAKDLFLANLSHELRTPLTAILIHAQSLKAGHLDPAAVSRAAARIEASTRRQARLVEDLLDVSRIVSGKLAVEPEPLDWRALVAGVVESVRPTAELSGVLLGTPAAGDPLPCRGDPGRLQQVVSNLLSNALKFTPTGGRVDALVDADGDQVRLVVSDTGRGIEAAFLPHVFEQFAQEEGGASHHPGLGLGLAIVQDIVRLHGGVVRVESPGRDQGATFTVTLPREAPVTAGP
jgi:two-component system CheB/CheR fusion protein